MSRSQREPPFCDQCGKEDGEGYFTLSGGDLDIAMEFCTPTCLKNWLLDLYVIKEEPCREA